MTASPRSRSQLQAPSGTARASSASVLENIYRRWKLGHESSVGQTGPLCDLYPCLHRAWPRPGVQLAGRAIRRRLCLYQKPGPCWLDPAPELRRTSATECTACKARHAALEPLCLIAHATFEGFGPIALHEIMTAIEQQ